MNATVLSLPCGKISKSANTYPVFIFVRDFFLSVLLRIVSCIFAFDGHFVEKGRGHFEIATGTHRES